MSLTTISSAIVGHVDILGFRALVRADCDKHRIAKRLDQAFRRALEAFGGKEALLGTPDAEWKVRVFSDCLCVSKPLTDIGLLVTVDAMSSFVREMMIAGFPIRGGVAIGTHSESELLIFSQAQIDAYDLEAEHARFPRIVLSDQLVKRLDAIEDDDIRRTAKELVIIDSDSIAFVNYLVFEEEDSWLSGHDFYNRQKSNLEDALKDRTLQSGVIEKYAWMAKFHNWALYHTAQVLKRSGNLNEDNVWSFSSLIVDHQHGTGDFHSLLWKDRTFETPPQYEDELAIDWIKQWPTALTEDDEEEPDREPEP